jgi:hypothetical protein
MLPARAYGSRPTSSAGRTRGTLAPSTTTRGSAAQRKYYARAGVTQEVRTVETIPGTSTTGCRARSPRARMASPAWNSRPSLFSFHTSGMLLMKRRHSASMRTRSYRARYVGMSGSSCGVMSTKPRKMPTVRCAPFYFFSNPDGMPKAAARARSKRQPKWSCGFGSLECQNELQNDVQNGPKTGVVFYIELPYCHCLSQIHPLSPANPAKSQLA